MGADRAGLWDGDLVSDAGEGEVVVLARSTQQYM